MMLGFRLLLMLALGGVSYLSFAPLDPPGPINHLDKLGHLLAFLLLAWLADFAFPRLSFGIEKILPLLGFGLLIELVQQQLPYRQFSWLDWMADGLGIAAYLLMVPLLQRLPLLSIRWSRRFPAPG
jgi:hypothetical protein